MIIQPTSICILAAGDLAAGDVGVGRSGSTPVLPSTETLQMATKPTRRRAPPRCYVGTSGWQYGHWKGVFYPEGLKPADRLGFYAQHLNTLELNVTFYRGVKPATFQKWYETVPPEFLFSVKMSRFITHIKRLTVEGESVQRFIRDVGALKEKLGVILIQLPPSLKYDRSRMVGFFDLLDSRFRYTIEARNKTFINDEFFSILGERNIAWCIAESAGRYPCHEVITAPFVYVRLHGRTVLYASNYTDGELRELAGKIHGWARDTFVYFDNDFKGFAVLNALTLARMLASG